MGRDDFPSSVELLTSIRACIDNGERLLDDTLRREFREPPATNLYIAMIAQEEFAKAFVLYLVREGTIPWSKKVLRAMNDHACKQLVGVILDYLNPPLDETYEQMLDRIRVEVALGDQLPRRMTDVVAILRYEKIGRWESPLWFWSEAPDYEPSIRKLAEGKRDRIKQDALYVRIGADGRVVSLPCDTKECDCEEELERARSYARFLATLVEAPDYRSEYRKIKSFIALLFAEKLVVESE